MIIGITGYPGSGKDTLGDELVSRRLLNESVQHIGMSDALCKRFLMCRPATPLGQIIQTVEELDECKRLYPQVREAIQEFGMSMREISRDIWVKAMLQDLDKAAAHRVVSGIRLANEAVVCDLLVAVTRPGFGPVNDHVSETETENRIDEADIVLVNDGTPFELYTQFMTEYADYCLRLRNQQSSLRCNQDSLHGNAVRRDG